jgi:hypothetical protein
MGDIGEQGEPIEVPWSEPVTVPEKVPEKSPEPVELPS